MPLDYTEFNLLRDYIHDACGISINNEKSYLIESRLANLLVETGCRNFTEFHEKARHDSDGSLKEEIIDAITTKETSWFRDKLPWIVMKEAIWPDLLEKLRSGRKSKIRVWSAACSTGQEPYSLAMLIDEWLSSVGTRGIRPEQFEILGTDISGGAISVAVSGRYNRIAMSRGMTDERKARYFKECGGAWVLDEIIRDRVEFKRFNLMTPLYPLGRFDVILMRNVAIYFSDAFKKDLFRRVSDSLCRDGHLLIGASECLLGYSTDFEMRQHGKAIYYQLKQ